MNIILYVCDSLRADYLTPYGCSWKTSPNLEKIASESIICENAFSQSTWTRASAASLLSSTYPPVHGVETTKDSYPSELPSLVQELQDEGFHTVVVTAMGNVSPDFGFDAGVDQYFELYKDRSILQSSDHVSVTEVFWKDHFGENEVGVATGEDINRCLETVFNQHVDEDLFVLVWSLDTHDPYFHRSNDCVEFTPVKDEEPYWPGDVTTYTELRDLRSLYKDMVRYADREIGNLVSILKREGMYSDTLLVVTADHGEAFDEHGRIGHGHEPYDEEIHVPLLFRFPEEELTGRIPKPVELNDVYPTILEWVGRKPESRFVSGESLLDGTEFGSDRSDVFVQTNMGDVENKYMAVRTAEYKYIVSVPPTINHVGSVSELYSILSKKFKNVVARSATVYDLEMDPGEQAPITLEDAPADLATMLDEWQKEMLDKAGEITHSDWNRMDDDVEQQLTALGYID